MLLPNRGLFSVLPRRFGALNSLFIVLAIALPSPVVFAWGGGHDPLNEFAVEVLPEPVLATLPPEFRKKVVAWSHAPDDFTPWEKQQKVTVHPDDLAYLHGLKMNHPYSLHAPRGQAANFILLVNAFRAKAPDRIAYWSACLLHTFADEAAANHDPLVHIITYAYKAGYKMDMGKAGVVDFVEVTRKPEDRAVIEGLLHDYTPQVLGTDPEKLLVRIMLHGLEANVYMTEHGARVARTFATAASEAQVADGRKALAELGVYGVRSGVDAIWTACTLAQSDTVPELTDSVQKAYGTQRAAFLAERALTHDSAYEGLLDVTVEPPSPAIGVLLEPSQTMNKAQLCFNSKWMMSATMRLLQDAKVPYRPLDIRKLDPKAVPDVTRMPAVAICAGGLHHGLTLKWLQGYSKAGGKILLIGGDHRGVLGELSKALDKPKDAHFPVTAKYGQNNTDYINALRVRFVGDAAAVLGNDALPFIHNPDTKAGWQKPKCPYAIVKANDRVRPWAQLLEGDSVLTVAGLALGADNQPAHVFLPEYLVSPYLLTNEPPLTDPSRPRFDAVGQKLVATAFRLLAPALFPAP